MDYKLAPILLLLLSEALRAAEPSSASETWSAMEAKRRGLGAFHQEFDVVRTFKTTSGLKSSNWTTVLDASKGQWREVSLMGSGTRSRIFDGKDLFTMLDRDDEYMRAKLSPKDGPPLPLPYNGIDLDWSKAVIMQRAPCPLTKVSHECISIKAPVKPRVEPGGRDLRKVLDGTERIVLDTETGMTIFLELVENVDTGHTVYQSDTSYTVKRLVYGDQPDPSLFHLPTTATREVKEFSKWDAASMKKELTGKPAVAMQVKDIQGRAISLNDFKGKTVLLEFWATWCGPCRADGPSLDKLYQKYGDKNLVILGISVDEERAVVEKFLSAHPHLYPVVLSSENQIPDSYHVHVFPTYMVIDTDGNFAAATEGEKGFSDLRKLLKKAGLETD